MAEKSLKDLTNAVYRIAENSPKIQKDVEKIREAICSQDGILDILTSMSKNIENIDKNSKSSLKNLKNTKSKSLGGNDKKLLSNSNTITKTLNNIFEHLKKNLGKSGISGKLSGSNFKGGRSNPNSKSSKLENISRSIDIIAKLKKVSLKDFVVSKLKLKYIKSIMERSLKIFKKFKNSKEAEETISFVQSSIDLVKKLAKISILSKPAQVGAKAIELIFFGKSGRGGLFKTFTKINKNKKEIKKAKKSVKDITAICGSMFLTSLALAGIAAIGPVVWVGALLTSGIVFMLVGTFKLLSKSLKSFKKGAVAFAIMSAGIIAFSVGFGLLRRMTKDLSWKEVGIMLGVITGSALAFAGVGLLHTQIIKGSIASAAMGVGMAAFSLGLLALRTVSRGMTLGDVGLMAASVALSGLAVAGVGLLAIPIAIGSATLLFMGASLGAFALSLMAWKNIDAEKPIKNIGIAVNGLRDIFGLDLGKRSDNKGSLEKIGGGIVDLITSALQFGGTFFMAGAILFLGVAVGALAFALKPWDNYDPSNAIGNISYAVSGLKTAFGLDDRKDESISGKALGAVGDLFGFASSILQFGSTFFQMGSLLVGTIAMDLIRLALKPWDNYDPSKAIGNIGYALSGLRDIFGLTSMDKNSVVGKIGNAVGDLFSLGSSFLQMGSTFVQMGTLLIATGSLKSIQENLKSWDNYDGSKAIQNIHNTLDKLRTELGLNKKSKDESGWSKFKGFVKDLASTAANIAKINPIFSELANMVFATASIDEIRKALQPWDKFDSKTAITHIKATLVSLRTLLNSKTSKLNKDDMKEFKDISNDFRKAMNNLLDGAKKSEKISEGISRLNSELSKWSKGSYDNAGVLSKSIIRVNNAFKQVKYKDIKKKSKTMMDLFKTISKKKIKEKYSSIPIRNSVDAINALDISKAKIMMDLFKSFDRIKSQKPFDRFNNAVDKFVDGCMYIVDSINGMTNPEVSPQNPQQNTNTQQPVQQSRETVNSNFTQQNMQQLADAIAHALRSLPVRINPNMMDINLVVDGVSGKTVKLTLQD